jgi:hypothetical protein
LQKKFVFPLNLRLLFQNFSFGTATNDLVFPALSCCAWPCLEKPGKFCFFSPVSKNNSNRGFYFAGACAMLEQAQEQGDVKMNGNILVFKKFIVLTQGMFKVLRARYYKPICVDEPAEEKPTGKTVRRRPPVVLFNAAGRYGPAPGRL